MNGTYELHNSPDGKVILLDTSTGEAYTVESRYHKGDYRWFK